MSKRIYMTIFKLILTSSLNTETLIKTITNKLIKLPNKNIIIHIITIQKISRIGTEQEVPFLNLKF